MLGSRLLNKEAPFEEFILAVQQWRELGISEELWHTRHEDDSFAQIQYACTDGLKQKLNEEIDSILTEEWSGNKVQ